MPTSAEHSTADPQVVEDQFARIAPYYAKAYRLNVTLPASLRQEAIDHWHRGGDRTLLGAAVAVIQTLDDWRERHSATTGTAQRSAA